MTIRFDVDYTGVVQTAEVAIADTLYRAGIAIGVKQPGVCWDRSVCGNDFMIQRALWYRDSGGFPLAEMIQAAGEEVVNAAIEVAVDLRWGARGAAALGPIGAVIDAAFAVVDIATCETGTDSGGLVDVTISVQNGQNYDAYLLFESRAAAVAAGGDAWSYVDFYDYVSPNCGGTREGIQIDYDSHGLYLFPR